MSKSKTTKEEELTSKYDPYKNKICDKSMSQEECELAILREAVYDNEEIQDEIEKEKVVIDETITQIFEILEAYIVKKKLLLYGGFAINALLPEYAKFYDPKHEIPDYDIYSPNALEDAIELVDFLFENGFKEVETKAGVHYMTYKVFVNFIPVADISMLDKSIFDNLQRESVIINRLHYCPVNFLRRNIYKELSQPQGDIQRWEKIYKRLNKINENYPLDISTDCENIEFQRKMESVETTKGEEIYEIVKNAFIYLGAVFLGGYASRLYSQYMPIGTRKIIEKIPDFEVLYDDIVKGSQLLKERLHAKGEKRVKIIYHENIGEIIPESYEIQVNNDTVAFIYKPNACYSYNIVDSDKQQIKVASIDTMLFFCYTFYYSSEPYHSRDKNSCIIKSLIKVEEENRLNQKGLLKRFSIECIGSQKNLADVKEEKTKKFKELFHKRNTREYSEWFLKYNPVFQPRPAFMRHRDKYKKVRFSLKKPRYRYRYLHTSSPDVRSETEIEDLKEGESSKTSLFFSKQPKSKFNKRVRKTRKGRKNNARGVRFALQNNSTNYHKPNKGSKYDTLSETPVTSKSESEIQSEYNTTNKYNKRKYTRREKPFNKRYTRFNSPKIVNSMELYKKQKKHKKEINPTNYETEQYYQKENKRKMDSLKKILGFKDEGKTKNEFLNQFSL